MPVEGVLFDKDGTLFDFTASWSAWTERLLAELSGGDPGRAQAMAGALGFDPRTRQFLPGSPVVSQTNAEIASILLPHLRGLDAPALIARMTALALAAPMVPVVPLAPLMARLRGAGLRLGLATNDAEVAARGHLAAAGVAASFDFVAGFDSGWGGKPAPGMLLAFAEACGLEPAAVVVVGDSRHDLAAARAAGMRAVAVLTGPATAAELADGAETVLPHIGHLPGWLSLPPEAAASTGPGAFAEV
jgi:phosphoglycolate phosphatase